MSNVQNVWMLFLAIYMLRLTGQGLLPHTSSTSMARAFRQDRGKAISMAALGHPVGETFFPLVMVLLVGLLGWRNTWLMNALLVAVILLPLTAWLLRGQTVGSRYIDATTDPVEAQAVLQRQWCRKDVLQDPRFYLMLPAVLTPAMMVSGVFFHQVQLVADKGWTMSWFAGTFFWYALGTVVASLSSGMWMDRVGVFRLCPFFLIPLTVGLMLLASGNHPMLAVLFMLAAGLSIGISSLLMTTLWAEVYGTRHLGAIRAMVSSCMVFSTALTPVGIGWLLDMRIPLNSILLSAAGVVVLAGVLALWSVRGYQQAKGMEAPCHV